ncbi:ABC transporter permease [Rhodococcoides yunnanense]|uniref:ABC transporter permease n=1 Tax=Rhodococcoides yunnanense TaxID=278209 RepID=UPI000932F110|nr:ABC transporter permease [Rhodococcus yunnanensis]
MARYTAARIGRAVVVLFLTYTGSFLLLNIVPSDPIALRLADPNSAISPEDAEALYSYYGLDKPLPEQYFDRLVNLFHGDLGFSITSGDQVTDRILSVLPSTLQLTALGLLLAIVLALAIVGAANLTRRRWFAESLDNLPNLFVAVPMFWLGLLIIQFFSFKLNLFSAVDAQPVSSLIFASLALAVPISAPIAQVLNSNVRSMSREAFVAVLAAKGLSRYAIFYRHLLRNAALPAVTIAGITLGELIAGAVVTETIFARNGLGQLTENAVTTQDLPVVQGIVLFAALVFVVVNLVVDLVYPKLDPRLRQRRLTASTRKVSA